MPSACERVAKRGRYTPSGMANVSTSAEFVAKDLIGPNSMRRDVSLNDNIREWF